MSRIALTEAQGWAETTKLPVVALNTNLLDQIEAEVLAQVASAHDTTTWVDASTTPQLVRVAIAKLYVSYLIRKAYSEEEGNENAYALQLEKNAQMLIEGIADGTLDLPGISTTQGQPSFYPTDASSAQEPTEDDYSLGGPYFSMGRNF